MISYEQVFRLDWNFEISFIPTTDMMLISSCLGFIVKLGFPRFMSKAFSCCLLVIGKGHKQAQCFSFCVRYITSAVLFKAADSQTLERGCTDNKKILHAANRGQFCRTRENQWTKIEAWLWNDMMEVFDMLGMSPILRICRLGTSSPNFLNDSWLT